VLGRIEKKLLIETDKRGKKVFPEATANLTLFKHIMHFYTKKGN
jgi:hypothetical protein